MANVVERVAQRVAQGYEQAKKARESLEFLRELGGSGDKEEMRLSEAEAKLDQMAAAVQKKIEQTTE